MVDDPGRGGPPRPPLNSIDAGWEDSQTEVSPAPAPVRAADPQERTAVLTESDLAAMQRGRAGDDGSTVALGGGELDDLVERSAPAPTGENTVALGAREIDQLLESGKRIEGGGFRVGGPPPEPKPDLGDDPFAGMEMGEPAASDAVVAPDPGAPSAGAGIDATQRSASPAAASAGVDVTERAAGPYDHIAAPEIDTTKLDPFVAPAGFGGMTARAAGPPERARVEPLPIAAGSGAAPPGAPPAPYGAPRASDDGSALTAKPVAAPPPVHVAVIAAGVAAFAVAGIVVVWLAVRGRGAAPPAVATSPPAGIVIPAGVKQPPVGPIEDEVQEALARLRDGVGRCVRDNIRVLPGTSPAIPPALDALKGGAYTSSTSDWATPVWACAGFKMAAPQRFQLQWQQTKTNKEGRAVAWIDDDRDGKADRAFGFSAKLKKRGEVEIGEIGPVDASIPPATR